MSLLSPIRTVRAPALGDHWLTGGPLTLRGLRGRVVLVDFWEYTCVNCIRTLPYVQEWHRRYEPHGLTVIGVHAPEFSFSRTGEAVRHAIDEFGLTYPVLLDNDFQTWQAFANRAWPAKYLVDAAGYVRYSHTGEGCYGETEKAIQTLLRERESNLALPPVNAPDEPAGGVCERPTPELYLGYQRGRAVNQNIVEDRMAEYSWAGESAADLPEWNGCWRITREYAEAGERAQVRLAYGAAQVNAVMAGTGQVRWPGGEVEVTRPRMYTLIAGSEFQRGLLQLDVEGGVQMYAFSFSGCA